VLTVDQLNRRILVYRDATNDQRYSSEDRDAFAQYLQNDRGELRRRLLSDRGQRDDRLRRPDNGYRLDMDIVPRGPRQQSVWAAEVDDDQIEEQFAARPLRPLPRRYSRADFFAQPEMVMEQPVVRQSIPGVELDTIHFGFNESFIREEEIANLDRIGRIIERIVAAHPNEVFVIEGNTDAVGDDSYNLRLSKDRAEAVKQALTQYYVIAPDNLVTAGLGERYLKIPTPEPEQENRRVTIRRVTPLLQN
jgi:outer membrane protein OmpA-like peptidoglycan-associated protein